MPRYARTIATVFASLALMALAAELTVRFDEWLRFGMPFLGNPDETVDLRIVDTLGVRGRPNGRYLRFHLNNYGFRAKTDITVARRPGCERVMIVGASETFGATEPDGMEYPAQLARNLEHRGCTEVLNAGAPGVGLSTIRYTWNQYWRQFRPDYVLIYPSPMFYLGSKPPTEVTREGLRRVTAPEVSFRPRLILLAHEALSYPEVIQRRRVQRSLRNALQSLPNDSVWHDVPEDRVASFVADLDSLIADVRRAGATPVLMSHAMRFAIPPHPDDADMLAAWRKYSPRALPDVMLRFEARAADETRALAARRGVALADVACALSGRRVLFADFVHFTERGAAIVAAVAERALHPDSTSGIAQAGAERPSSQSCDVKQTLTGREASAASY